MSLLDSVTIFSVIIDSVIIISSFGSLVFFGGGGHHILSELFERSLTVLSNSLTVGSSRLFPLEAITYGLAVLGRDVSSWFFILSLFLYQNLCT